MKRVGVLVAVFSMLFGISACRSDNSTNVPDSNSNDELNYVPTIPGLNITRSKTIPEVFKHLNKYKTVNNKDYIVHYRYRGDGMMLAGGGFNFKVANLNKLNCSLGPQDDSAPANYASCNGKINDSKIIKVDTQGNQVSGVSIKKSNVNDWKNAFSNERTIPANFDSMVKVLPVGSKIVIRKPNMSDKNMEKNGFIGVTCVVPDKKSFACIDTLYNFFYISGNKVVLSIDKY